MEDELTERTKGAYQAYGDHVEWKNYAGLPMPKWEDLPPRIQGAWCAAISSVMRLNPKDYRLEDLKTAMELGGAAIAVVGLPGVDMVGTVPCALCGGQGTLRTATGATGEGAWKDITCPRCKGTKNDPEGARPVLRCSPYAKPR